MSKHNNVNPNFYNIGGREHTEGADKGTTHSDQKAQLANSKKSATEQGDANFIPGEAPVGQPGRTRSKKK
jgi:hypothetical protein